MEINRRDWRKQDAKATLSPFSLHCRKLCINKKRNRFEVDVFSPRGRDWIPTQRTSSKLILFLSDWIHLLCRSLYCESILCSIFVSPLRTDTRRLALQTEIVQDGSAGDIPAYLQCPFTPAERKQHTDNTSGNDHSSVCEVTFNSHLTSMQPGLKLHNSAYVSTQAVFKRWTHPQWACFSEPDHIWITAE